MLNHILQLLCTRKELSLLSCLHSRWTDKPSPSITPSYSSFNSSLFPVLCLSAPEWQSGWKVKVKFNCSLKTVVKPNSIIHYYKHAILSQTEITSRRREGVVHKDRDWNLKKEKKDFAASSKLNSSPDVELL